jgi:hypothetical protein
MSVSENKSNIASNRRKIFEVEAQVMYNRANCYLTRSLVQENQALIQKNYTAAFMGNRQLANGNTDDLFRNRVALLSAMPVNGPVQENYREALKNKAKLEYLEHRSKLNEKVLQISQKMAEVNSAMISINRDILSTNEEIVQYNAAQIAENSRLLNGGLNAEGATPASNAEIIAGNKKRIEDVASRAAANKKLLQTLYDETSANRGR